MQNHLSRPGFTILFLASVSVLTGCPDRPPPAAQPYVEAEASPPGLDDAAPAPSGSAPESVSSGTPNPYPAKPKQAAPVPLPAGAGASVPLQKYIVVDQFGYRPELAKVAVLVSPVKGWNAGDRYQPGPEFELRRWSDTTVVTRGPTRAWQAGKVDEEAGDRGAWFDFSSVKERGLYYVYDAKNNVRSHPFEIGADVYLRVLKTATKAFYFNRANFEKKPPFSCVEKRCWSMGVDNLGPGQDREARSVTERENAKTARDLSGGWWDAGDTNKYVTFTLDPFHQLLTAYAERPQAFGDDFGIPESGNGLPDLIDELSVELEWLKKMQPADLKGGALLKVGVTDYASPLPDQSRQPRYYYPGACSSATIVVASEFAHAALVLKSFPRFEAEIPKLTKRARDAWRFFHANPKNENCDNGTIRSGDADIALGGQEQAAVVAAIYLFALTGDAQFGDYLQQNYGKTRPLLEDRWSAYSQSQGDALLYYASLPNAEPSVKQAILDRKRSQAETVDIYKFRPELDLYRAYLRADSYHWGSNNVRASYGNTNYDVVQYGLVPAAARATYVERAAELLHSFHGVNPMQLVYLTNMYADGAEASADETFHAWFRDKDPIWDNARSSRLGPAPGYVTGGPNRWYCEGQDPNQHACAKSPVRAQPPEKAYVDLNTGWDPSNAFDRSWELNEPAIYYQASYVRLVSKFVGE